MTTVQVNVNMIAAMNKAVNISQAIQIQNVQICQIGKNKNDTDEKYINSNQCNKLNVLAALMNNYKKKTSNFLEKNKQVI